MKHFKESSLYNVDKAIVEHKNVITEIHSGCSIAQPSTSAAAKNPSE